MGLQAIHRIDSHFAEDKAAVRAVWRTDGGLEQGSTHASVRYPGTRRRPLDCWKALVAWAALGPKWY